MKMTAMLGVQKGKRLFLTHKKLARIVHNDLAK